jgi:hypothetical protein
MVRGEDAGVARQEGWAMSGAGPGPKDLATCRACGEAIVFLQTLNAKTGKRGRMPVNVLPTDKKFRGPNAGEIDYLHGIHQSHFATCPEAGRFRSDR